MGMAILLTILMRLKTFFTLTLSQIMKIVISEVWITLLRSSKISTSLP